jgi:gliding motility-associated-like protein
MIFNKNKTFKTSTLKSFSFSLFFIINFGLLSQCPSDATFSKLDWNAGFPFTAFSPTTFDCTDGIQQIWKMPELTIGTASEIQAFPGFQVNLPSGLSATETSVLVSINGIPYSYYGPTAPANVIDWGPLSGNYDIIEPYIAGGSNVTLEICDTRVATQSIPYTIYDHATGVTLLSNTATPSNGNCQTISFTTITSPTMTWDIDANNTLITDINNGSATFDPSSLSAGSHTINYTFNNNNGCTLSASQNITITCATPPTCNATIGTFSFQINNSSTSTASSFDLAPNETFLITANGDATLPPVGIDNEQSGIGYAAFSCDPSGYSLSDPTKYNTTDMPCFLGFHYNPTMNDENGANSQVNGSGLTSWWFVPITFDDVCHPSRPSSPCQSGAASNIGIDTDSDGCFANGSPIQINYVSASCGDCSNPSCSIYLTPNGANSPSATYPNSNHITENAVGPSTITQCHLVTVTLNNQRLGFRQGIFQTNTGCATRTYELKAADINGQCTGAAIAKSQDGTYSLNFNPEWDNLTPGDYIMCITQTLGVGCDIDYINTGYYLEDITPACPTDQTLGLLDWNAGFPFLPFTPTTLNCNDGVQTIWKTPENTIGTAGEVQGFPGIQIEIPSGLSSTESSILIYINGTPYSYYGNNAPANVLDWGPLTSSYHIIEPYIEGGSNVTLEICDTRGNAQSIPYTIYDHATGAILLNGIATPSIGNCITISFTTITSPTMTWDIDGDNSIISDLNNGSATFDPADLTPGNHIINYTFDNGNGCTLSATQNITINQYVTPTLNAIPNLCENSTAPPLQTPSNNNITGTWIPTTINTSSEGTTTYTFTPDAGQCANSITQDVTIEANTLPTFNAISPICSGDPITLNNSSIENITGTWSPTIDNTTTTTYTFTPSNGQCALNTTLDVIVNPIQTPTFTLDNDICINSSQITLPLTSDNNITGTWNVSNVNLSQTGSTTYTFTPASNQCAVITTETITVYDLPIAKANPISISGKPVLNVDFTNLSLNATNLSWEFGNGETSNTIGGVSSSYLTPGNYTVTLTASNNICPDSVWTGTVTVIYDSLEFIIPNIFTPNGDGVNDEFYIELNNAESFEAIIFNRWGNEVKTLSAVNEKWNGDAKDGKKVTAGVYYIKYKIVGLDKSVFEGTTFFHIEI